MRKIVSIIVTMSIFLSAFAFNVSAEDAALQKAYKSLSREIMTTEVYYALTENINLDSTYLCEKMGVEGVSIAWESSDENIIDTSGRITREKYQNNTVTLTASITDGNETLTKNFDFTVLALSAKTYFADNFYYPEQVNDIITNATSKWAFTRSHEYTETTGGMTAVVTERGEETTNYAMKGYRKGRDESIHYTRCKLSEMASGKIAWETDVYMENPGYANQDLLMYEFYGKYDNGETALIADFRFRLDNPTSIVMFEYHFEGSKSTAKHWAGGNTPKPERWNRLRVEFDTEEQYYDIFINGKKVNSTPIPFYERDRIGYERDICDGITSMNFGPFRQHHNLAVTMDDMVFYDNNRVASENPEVYTVADEMDFSLLTDEVADELTKDLDLSLSSIQDVINEEGVTVTWASSNSDVISIEGDTAVVHRGIVTQDAVLTATLKYSGASYELPIEYPVSVLAGDDYINVNRIIDNVTAEMFSTEPASAITKNLDFSYENIDRFVSTDGVELQFTSSNEDYISNDGVVTRSNERKNVAITLTATDLVSGYSLEKRFIFTVLAEKEFVYYSTNFAFPEYDGQNAEPLPNWSIGTFKENYYVSTIENLDDDGYVLFSKRDVVNTSDYANFSTLSPSQKLKNKVTFKAKFKFEHSNDKGKYMLYVNGFYKGSTSQVRLVEINFDYSARRTYFSFYEGDTSVGGSITKVPPAGEWFDLEMVFDELNQSFNLYINGENYTLNEGFFVNRSKTGNENKIIDGIKNIQFNSYRYTGNNRIYCDDVSVIGEKVVHQACEFFIDGVKVRNLKTMPYYSGSVLNARQLISNDTNEAITVTPVLAVYHLGKLTHIRKGDDVTVKVGGVSTVNFDDIEIPDTNLENVEIRTFAVSTGLAPEGEKLTINSNAVYAYSGEEYYYEDTGFTAIYADVFGETAYKPYFNAQAWSADSTKLYIQMANYNIYEFNTVTEELRFIDAGANVFGLVVTPQNKLIYPNRKRDIIEMDCDTYEKRLVASMPEGQNNKPSLLTVSNDGKKLLFTWSNAIGDAEMKNEYYRDLPILNMDTGEWDLSNAYGFVDNTYWNPGLNPAYPNLILLNHGAAKGSTFDRNWVYNTETKTAENVFKQKPYSTTTSGETHSHETWSYDGENLFIDKGAGSLIGHSGIMSFDKDGKNRRHSNDDYSYLHLGVSPANKRWVVSDTAYGNGQNSNIVLVDTHSGKAYLLGQTNQKGTDSVGHSHPAFSPDGQKVYFGMNNGDYTAFGVGFIDVYEIVNIPDELEIINLSNSCTAESYPDTDHEIKTITKDGEKAYSIAKGKVMYVNYTLDELEDSEAVIEFTYFDDEGSFDLKYYDWIVDPETHNELKPMTISITKENTGKWVTKRIEIPDINLENMDWFCGDFKFVPVEGDLIIKSANLGIPVDFEEISDNQLADYIIRDFVLGNHSLTSSNPAVISENGKVTRQAEDTNVTIRIDGASEYEVTVKGLDTEVLYQSNFHYPEKENDFINGIAGWSSPTEDNRIHGKIQSDNGNYYLENRLDVVSNYEWAVAYTNNDLAEKKKVTIELTLKYLQDAEITQFYYNIQAGDTRIGRLTISEKTLYLNGISVTRAALGGENRVKLVFDFENGTYDFYVDGVKANKEPMALEETTVKTVSQLQFVCPRTEQYIGAVIGIDDLVITAEK